MLRDGSLPRTSRPLSPSTGWNPSSSAAAAALSPAASIHAGFQYTTRAGLFDWRTLHGINIEAAVRSVYCHVVWTEDGVVWATIPSLTERGLAHDAWAMHGSAWLDFSCGGQIVCRSAAPSAFSINTIHWR